MKKSKKSKSLKSSKKFVVAKSDAYAQAAPTPKTLKESVADATKGMKVAGAPATTGKSNTVGGTTFVPATGGGSGTWSGPLANMPSKKSCWHKGHTPVFVLPVGDTTIEICGSASKSLDEYPAGTLLVNCTNSYENHASLKRLPRGYETLNAHAYNPPCIEIEWPDGSVPNLQPGFWSELPRLAAAQGVKKIVAYCLGSHGRTGTFLAATAMVGLRLNAVQAVAMIRAKHCESAVETHSQVEFLYDLETWMVSQGLLPAMSEGDITPSYYVASKAAAAAASTGTPLGGKVSDAADDKWGKVTDEQFKFGNF